jgi:acetyltransferase-like isoleucine patch superfamily enzyme
MTGHRKERLVKRPATEESVTNVVYEGLILGEGTVVEGPCVLSKPPRGARPGQLETHIGSDGVVRAFTTIYAGVQIGDRFQTGHGASIREDNVIGDDVVIGTNAVLEHGNRIGDRARVHTGCFLELVTVEDDVFIGPNVVFADDAHPPCPRYAECKGGAHVGKRAKIGANSTILPGVRIGEGALVGAGSVVVCDVPDGAVVCGSPARVVKDVADLECHAGYYDKPYDWELSLTGGGGGRGEIR